MIVDTISTSDLESDRFRHPNSLESEFESSTIQFGTPKLTLLPPWGRPCFYVLIQLCSFQFRTQSISIIVHFLEDSVLTLVQLKGICPNCNRIQNMIKTFCSNLLATVKQLFDNFRLDRFIIEVNYGNVENSIKLVLLVTPILKLSLGKLFDSKKLFKNIWYWFC